MSFEVTATDGAARAGILRTAHGDVPTPAFMPVGTKGTVKSLHPDELLDLGAGMILGNTYHLHFRPGDELIAELGGLHSFMGWDGPILTDSGGFQVFSLRDTLGAVDDDGVTFGSVYDGAATRFTPESVARIQANLGSDVAMCLDVCAPAGVGERDLAEAVRLTAAWARRQRTAPRAPGQLVFGITQGAAPTPSCAAARSPRSPRSTSTATRSAGSPSARTARRCSTRPGGPPRCCPPTRPGTSWGSATRRGSSA